MLQISVNNYDIYIAKVLGAAMFPVGDQAKMMLLCNAWNIRKLYPKAYTFSNPRLKDSDVAIFLERSVSLRTGTHQRFLTDLTIQGAFEFWRWATKEQGVAIGTRGTDCGAGPRSHP